MALVCDRLALGVIFRQNKATRLAVASLVQKFLRSPTNMSQLKVLAAFKVVQELYQALLQ